MKKLDQLGILFNIILTVVYVPLSLFSWLLQMASESTIGVTNLLYISLIDVFCVIAFLIPLLCIAAIVLSVVLRKKGYCVSSFVVQFVPLVIFILNIVLLAFAETLPAML